MQLTKGAIGNLINRYRAVLKKCHLLNAFGSLPWPVCWPWAVPFAQKPLMDRTSI